MKSLLTFILGLILTTLAVTAVAEPKPAPRVQATPLPYHRVSFEVNDHELTRAHFGPDLKRPFLYPVIGPSGRTLTRMGHPRDPVSHSHHNSVWLSHAKVNDVDFWSDTGKGRIVHQRLEKLTDSDDDASATSFNLWIDEAKHQTLLAERRRITVLPKEGGASLILIDSQLEAKTDVVFGKTPFGFLGVRMAKNIGVRDGGGTIRNSSGGVNEKNVLWKSAKWVDYSGAVTRDVQRLEGIAIFDHPKNPNHPSVFHVRDDGWMGSSFSFAAPVELANGKSLRLRYGLYVHDTSTADALDACWSAFAKSELDDLAPKAKPAAIKLVARGGTADDDKTAKRTPVMVQDFEKASLSPKVWVVNIPNENASVQLSTDHPHDGKQCLKLHYHFVGTGQFQYLGIPNKTKIQAPIHKLRFMLYGDDSKCSYGVQVSDARGETHQYGMNTGQGGIIDFKGWKEIVIDLDSRHETWGGDKNGKLDYPIAGIAFTIGQPTEKSKLFPVESDLYFDALSVDSEKGAEETLGCQVSVLAPAYCSDVKGDTRVTLAAPGFKNVTVKCWKQGGRFGSDSTVATVALDAKGNGSFVFPADDYPHGPIVVRIGGDNGTVKDNCYLQLYNKGGVSWNEGLPKEPPPAAKGMKLVFADDFKGPLSISSTDPKATYYDHKPPNGWQDFSVHTFSGHDSPKNPFAQVDTYLRIRASDKMHSSGLISSLKNDGSGIKVSAPCYFECRFLGPNAIGSWPGFWLMTDYMTDYSKLKDKTPCDELDIIEAYGGEGPGAPNAFDGYMISPHCWNQGKEGKDIETKAYQRMKNPIRMKKAGIPSTWFEAFHTYGCKVTENDTIYYCDDIEVGRHATLPLSKKQPLFFMLNLATGGGWPVDLSRYNGLVDMYIDYVRVYRQAP